VKTVLLLLFSLLLFAHEPITPIPQTIAFDQHKAALGKKLFEDTSLSSDGTVACVTCHQYDHGGAQASRFSPGVQGQLGGMNTPTVFNAIFNFRQFWNGRAKNLHEQADGPIHNPIEMDMNKKSIEKVLKASPYYQKHFKQIYQRAPSYNDMKDAIVEFEKALITPNSLFDQYLRNEKPLPPQAMQGYQLFKTFGCVTCHNGVNVGGNSYQKFGLINAFSAQQQSDDRYKVTNKPQDKHVYKVPSLRNIALTSPYFHDGSAATLRDAIKQMSYHNIGVQVDPNEVELLVAFLKTLTGEQPTFLDQE
jgi:cytochrome c peroxidase